MCLLFTRILS